VSGGYTWRPRTGPARPKRGQGHCALCGSIEHDRKTCGAEPVVGHIPASAEPARWTPANDADSGSAAAAAPDESTDVLAMARATPHLAANGRYKTATIPPYATKAERRALAMVVISDEDEALRPKTRADCANIPRPCPFVSCRFNLYLDVSPDTGAIKLNHPDKDPWDVGESCCLDVADREGVTLEEAGEALGVTRERARQLEQKAIAKAQRARPDLTEPGTSEPQTFNPFSVEAR